MDQFVFSFFQVVVFSYVKSSLYAFKNQLIAFNSTSLELAGKSKYLIHITSFLHPAI